MSKKEHYLSQYLTETDDKKAQELLERTLANMTGEPEENRFLFEALTTIEKNLHKTFGLDVETEVVYQAFAQGVGLFHGLLSRISKMKPEQLKLFSAFVKNQLDQVDIAYDFKMQIEVDKLEK